MNMPVIFIIIAILSLATIAGVLTQMLGLMPVTMPPADMKDVLFGGIVCAVCSIVGLAGFLCGRK